MTNPRNPNIPSAAYASGTVDSYNDRNGYGYIIPDEPDSPNDRLLVHRRSLRESSLVLEVGDRVVDSDKMIRVLKYIPSQLILMTSLSAVQTRVWIIVLVTI